VLGRLFKNTRLVRCATAAYEKYASFIQVLRALHPDIFEQPEKAKFFCTLLARFYN
jgi:hypothetical protein